MKICSFVLAGLLYFTTVPFCRCTLRRHCQVLEKKYFGQYLDLRFKNCKTFAQIDFSIAVSCDITDSLHLALNEVPLETDWLCLTIYHGRTLESEAFSRFTNLEALYITFKALNANKTESTELQPGTFNGLSRLSTLWIESYHGKFTIAFSEDTFCGLNALQELKLSEIQLSTFNFSVFSPVHHLDHLILESNSIYHLSEVTPSLGIFKNLQKLSIIDNNIYELKYSDCVVSNYSESYGTFLDFNISHLDLSGNVLNVIENRSLCNFPNLEMFKAEKTGIAIEDLLDAGIEAIKTISVSNNGFEKFDICRYASKFKAEELLIQFTNINKLATLRGSCERLKKLDLSYNYLEATKVSQIKELDHLLELNLSNNEIENLKICGNRTVPAMKLVYLNVSFNHMPNLKESQFSCLANLKVLSLENNKINYIQDFSFYGLDSLEVLNLQQNNLYTIGENMFSNLPYLQRLDLHENRIETIEAHTFRNLQNLQNVSLTYKLFDLLWWEFISSSLRHLSLKSGLLEIRQEFIHGFPFLESLEMDSADTIVSCGEFTEVKELRLNNVVRFICEELSWNLFANLTNLERLYYTGNPQDFSDLTLDGTLKYLPSLQFLQLQDTDKMVKYGKLHIYEMFHGLSQLKVLHLKNSGFENLDSTEIFRDLRELEFLLIENQNIQELTETVFESMPNLKYVYFLQVAFPCNCKFNGLLSWLESGTSISAINFREQECRIQKNTFNLVSFLRKNCQTDLDVIMFVVTFVFTSLFMCTSLFYESIWWYILYIIYTVKCWLNHKAQDRDHYEYDVFVSYNSNDEPWVTEQLLPNLEENGPPFFKVCIHNRDFEIGRDIVDNIIDSIYKSRWTVCVITRSYLQSNWCSLEMRMATYRLLAESKDSLILVFLDKISKEELQHYHRLTKLLDKKTYLEWSNDDNGQRLFWVRLRNVIAKSGRKLEQTIA